MLCKNCWLFRGERPQFNILVRERQKELIYYIGEWGIASSTRAECTGQSGNPHQATHQNRAVQASVTHYEDSGTSATNHSGEQTV